jgi:protein-export membrane protein SecD/preprotein translocase SecF subunit
MSNRLRWRVFVTLAITLVVSMAAWYPPLADRFGLPLPDAVEGRRLRLGLDLAGGVQTVLRVNTGEAIAADTRGTAERVRTALTDSGFDGARVETRGSSFTVTGVSDSQAADVARAVESVTPDFTRRTGAGGVTFVMRDEAAAAHKAATVEQARQVLARRVDALGVTEPLLAVQGEAGDEILLELPGVKDVDRAIAVVGATASLEWKLVEAGPAASPEALPRGPDGRPPAGTEVLAEGSGSSALYYLVQTEPAVTGRDLRSARPSRDEWNAPGVGFSLTRDAAERFASVTRSQAGRALAIVLDGRVQSAPVIEGPIEGGEGQIRGRFTEQEAADLALVLRAGALPASITYEGGSYVGPSLGAASVRAGLAASIAGLLLVAGFMLVYYRGAGVNAVLSIAVNLALLLGVMAYAGAALTLPGFAGLLLTIGMGVDSNVLIFERIREELASGRSPRAAVGAGFDRVLRTIVDTHVASLVAAAFLFQFGTGAVRGFATTLTFGLLTNVFTSVFVSRTLFELALSRRHGALIPARRIATQDATPAFATRRWRLRAAAFSLAALLTGGGVLATQGLPRGLDFTGGTLVRVTFAEPVSADDVRRAIPGDAIVQQLGLAGERQFLVRRAHAAGMQGADSLAESVGAITTAISSSPLPAFDVSGSDVVSASAGADLTRKGIYATMASLAGITGYLALRFGPSFGIGAVAATGHDMLMTTVLLALSGHELTLNVVAALLATAGYSVNDTIVIFDRVRENLRAARGAPLDHVVGTAVKQTMSRTIITAGTTLLALAALYMFGGDALRGFSFAMIVGVVTGTYSTIFIATSLAIALSRHEPGTRSEFTRESHTEQRR